MTDFCSCLPQACPGLRVQNKSLREAAVLPGYLTYFSEIIPSQRGALGMVPFHLVLCMDKENRKVFGKGLPACHAPRALAHDS